MLRGAPVARAVPAATVIENIIAADLVVRGILGDAFVDGVGAFRIGGMGCLGALERRRAIVTGDRQRMRSVARLSRMSADELDAGANCGFKTRSDVVGDLTDALIDRAGAGQRRQRTGHLRQRTDQLRPGADAGAEIIVHQLIDVGGTLAVGEEVLHVAAQTFSRARIGGEQSAEQARRNAADSP